MNTISSGALIIVSIDTNTGRMNATRLDTAPRRNRSRRAKPREFDLKSFFPYLVRIYYRAVSSSISSIYSSMFGLTVPEWRTMAVLGPDRAFSASEIVDYSSMDKVTVSRAIARLRKNGLLKRDIDGDDRRRSVVRLTDRGREIYETLVPEVLELEDDLLADLTKLERETLIRLMEKVRLRAEELEQARTETTP
jgi:DNA-binding MarR family transcriptional regulator